MLTIMPNTIDNFARPRDGQCQDIESLRSIVAIVVEERVSFVHAFDAESSKGMESFLLTNLQEKT